MKQATMLLVVLGALFTGSLSAWADSGNPFGFETNKHPLEYEYCKKEPGLYSGHGYKCSSAPRPHPELEEYALQFVEGIGVCFIGGGGRHLSESKFEMFHRQITKKYGPPTNRDGDILYQWGPSEPVDAKRERANKAITDAQTAIGIIKKRLENHESVPVERRSPVDEGEIVKLRRDLVRSQDVLDGASKDIQELADLREAGFKGLGDVKAIELRGVGHAIRIYFWLVTNDACQKKIKDKADHAF